MRGSAKDGLVIIADGELRPGLIAYGLRKPSPHIPHFPHDVWPARTDPHAFVLRGEGWQVVAWEIPVDVWPTADKWRAIVRATLRALITAGSAVAWMGPEGYFCDPPSLLTPQCMSGGVVASLTAQGEFKCPLDPRGPYKALTDTELLQLRSSSGGLASLGDTEESDIPQ
jgi:hypothetical protein